MWNGWAEHGSYVLSSLIKKRGENEHMKASNMGGMKQKGEVPEYMRGNRLCLCCFSTKAFCYMETSSFICEWVCETGIGQWVCSPTPCPTKSETSTKLRIWWIPPSFTRTRIISSFLSICLTEISTRHIFLVLNPPVASLSFSTHLLNWTFMSSHHSTCWRSQNPSFNLKQQ